MAQSSASEAPANLAEIEDAFVNVTFDEEANSGDPFYDPWVDQASAKFEGPATYGARALRRLYPNHSIVLFKDAPDVDILGFPFISKTANSPDDFINSLHFVPPARRMGQALGSFSNDIKFGSYRIKWGNAEFILYAVQYPRYITEVQQHYLLFEGPEKRSHELLLAAAAWKNQLHEEILVYNRTWSKDHALWEEVQKANWDDIILKPKFKKSMKKDVFGFFQSEKLFQSLSIPWKRGMILLGPPGNGKTITVKAIMKDCYAKGFAPLYVKSLKSSNGGELAIANVFRKAREMAPCVLVFEDLDSLITDENRSFFLNQLDGLEGNDGLLVIGSTNHFERLDPALSGRPSRFDRKHRFDDPDREERTMYARYWQNKLKSNKSVDFPNGLVEEIAASTDKFSFAYLKEAFVSTLVLLADADDGGESDDDIEIDDGYSCSYDYANAKATFSSLMREQIRTLRTQLEKDAGVQSKPDKDARSPSDPEGPPVIPRRLISRSIHPINHPSPSLVASEIDAWRTGARLALRSKRATTTTNAPDSGKLGRSGRPEWLLE
ncbi:uncharacterized protein FIBRA_01426 [Fibroporia radiculosa]|uniref:AAA+ ATPase domain-containing protein n=1 Tax=Fibroporia radiculosa TaxID=599839 RepID=J4G0Z4_9APHY|nr:uncharacterized protein FIBRA_01426 [Fibroporia radiculosa]CCL99408.1 predicted protein [Fibroporia radiculosa]